jgi:hypothetical protein
LKQKKLVNISKWFLKVILKLSNSYFRKFSASKCYQF